MNNSNEWAAVCIKLLQGPLYNEDREQTAWKNLLIWQNRISEYFEPLGLELFLDPAEGYAFLKQVEDENGETPNDLPRLIRKVPLSFELSLLCVILREALEHFDTSQSESNILIMNEREIKELLAVYLKDKTDQTRLFRELDTYLSRAVELTFLRELPITDTNAQTALAAGTKPLRSFEIRRILRSKIDIQFLLDFKLKLENYHDNAE